MAKIAPKENTTGKEVTSLKTGVAEIKKAKKSAKRAAPKIATQQPATQSSAVLALMTRVRWNEKKTALANITKNRPPKVVYVAAILIGVALIFSYKKSWFVAATVNNSPISNFELISRLNGQYRSQMLNQMINESIIMGEAKKKGVVISDKEIGDKVSEVESNVGGASALDGLLAQQGQTRASLKDQIKFQLIIEKLYGGEATVSAEEVNAFVDENKGSLQATDSAEQVKEAADILKQQRLTQIFQEKFQELKTTAKIQIF